MVTANKTMVDRDEARAKDRAFYAAHPEEMRAKAKRWYAENKEKLSANPRVRAATTASARAWAKRHPEQSHAVSCYNRAVRAGRRTKVAYCVVCGVTENLNAHHFSYAREHWLDVIGLCKDHHAALHRGVVLPEVGQEIDRILLEKTLVPEDADEWRDLFDSHEYQVNTAGEARRKNIWKERVGKDGSKFWVNLPAQLMRPGICDGHKNLHYVVDGKRCSVGVHRLVLMAFVGMPEEGQVCRHLDGNPGNNNLSNLAWGTVLENYQDSVKHGTAFHWGLKAGERMSVEERRRSRNAKQNRRRKIERNRISGAE